MTTPTSTQRVQSLHARCKAAGLVRRELHVHPDDWPAVREYAAQLQRKRQNKTPQSPK